MAADQMKRNWIQQRKALDVKQSFLRKEVDGWLEKFNYLSIVDNASADKRKQYSLLDDCSFHQKRFRDDFRDILADIGIVRKLLRSVKMLINAERRSTQNSGTFMIDSEYLSELERLLHNLEDKSAELKRKFMQSTVDLSQKERRLESELSDFDQRMLLWEQENIPIQPVPALETKFDSQITESKNSAGKVRIVTAKPNIQDQRIKRFEAYVTKTNGRTGGWSEMDHAAFTKLRAKYRAKGLDDFVEICSHQLGIEPEHVRAHENWFLEFLRLQEAKREAILEWRTRKIEKQPAESTLVHQNQEDEEAIMAKNNLEATLSKPAELTEEEKIRQETKAKVQRWKQEMEELKKKEEAEKRELEDQRIREEREKFLARQQELKNIVEQHRRLKEESGAQRQNTLSSENDGDNRARHRRSLSLVELKQRQQENLDRLRRQREELENLKFHEQEARKQRMEKIKAPIIKAVSAALNRTGSRLMENTKVVENRKAETDQEHDAEKVKRMFTPGYGIINTRILPHRHIPDWRRGI